MRRGSDICAVEDCDPDLLGLHAAYPDDFPFLLQSSSRDGSLGRYDILFACPEDSLVLDASGAVSGPYADASLGFLGSLDAWFHNERGASESRLPFNGGWFVYLGYELAAEIEPSLALARDELLPCAFATRCRAAIVRDSSGDNSWVVSESSLPPSAVKWLTDVLCDTGHSPSAPVVREIDEDDPGPFLKAVGEAKEHIAAGDIYQANLSRGWRTTVSEETSAAAVYRALCQANPAPFAGIARWKGSSIISSSPERLLKLRDGVASTRPIAGTRPRSADLAMDADLSSELIAHPKERAEHIMLIDLERNDLGRICRPGTVEVDEMMVIESYAHVHHIVSNVRGELLPEVTPGEAIRAVFPGGTITGCPKVKCMQIISELEEGPRGAYTGSIGYLNLDGSLDLNILIRTMVMHGNELTLRAGSGIVADSVAVSELAETRAKAKGLLRALAP